LLADLARVAVLLVTAVLRAVTLRDALSVEVADVGFDRAVGFALAGLTDIARATIDERAQVRANTGRRPGRVRNHSVGRPGLGPRLRRPLAVVTGRAVAIIETLAWMRFRQDSAEDLQVSKRSRRRKALEAGLFAVTSKESVTPVGIAEHRRIEQPEARGEPLPEAHHLVRLYVDDADDARHLRTLTLRLKAVLPTRIDVAHALTEALETFDELVCRRETALSVLLSLTGRLLVALVNWTPLARARNVHSFIHAQLTAASCSNTGVSGRLFAVPLMSNANPSAGSFAGIDVVATITTANRLEHAGAVATGGTGNAPVQI